MTKKKAVQESNETVASKIEETEKKLIQLRIDLLKNELKDVSQFKKLRKEIARMRTQLSLHQQ
ncbi:MAG: 50S ribosomal protein L29 [Candidatus Margulisiibacteriota bacterium]